MENQIPQAVQECSPQKKNHRLNNSSKILNDVTNMVSKAIDKNNLENALLVWRNKVATISDERILPQLLQNLGNTTSTFSRVLTVLICRETLEVKCYFPGTTSPIF